MKSGPRPPNTVRRRRAIVTFSEMTSHRNDFTGVRFTTVLLIPDSPAPGARPGPCRSRARTRGMAGTLSSASLFSEEGHSIQDPENRGGHFAASDDSITLG